MSKYSWDNPELQVLCGRCHFRDEAPELCHAVEPPIKKISIPTNVSSCAFIPDSYWNRITEERKQEIMDDVIDRSKSYYANKKDTEK